MSQRVGILRMSQKAHFLRTKRRWGGYVAAFDRFNFEMDADEWRRMGSPHVVVVSVQPWEDGNVPETG